jgi:hypothetical protein
MKKCSALILLACAFVLLTAERVAASPVTWDFIATSCSNDPFGCDPSQHYPLVLATLTLDGPDSSGLAQYGGPNLGDPFAFDLVASRFPGLSMVSSAEPMGPLFGFPPTYWVTAFLLSWTETDGVLTSVRAAMDTILTGVIIGLTSAEVNTDDPLGGCGNDCQLTGYWVIAPEPGSLALLASAFGVWGVIGRRRVLHATRSNERYHSAPEASSSAPGGAGASMRHGRAPRLGFLPRRNCRRIELARHPDRAAWRMVPEHRQAAASERGSVVRLGLTILEN